MSLVTTGQPMAILGNYYLNHGPHCTLTAPIYMFQSVIQAIHVQGKQVVSFSMDANNCLSFRAADTSSSSHCKHTCTEKIYSNIIYKSSYTIHLPPKITNNILQKTIQNISIQCSLYRLLYVNYITTGLQYYVPFLLNAPQQF